MKHRFSGLIALFCTLAVASACDVEIDAPDGSDGADGSDTDGDEGGGGKVLTGGSSDAGDDDDDTSAGPDLDPQDPGDGDDSAGGGDPGPLDPDPTGADAGDACADYCAVELSCDTYYETTDACMGECAQLRSEAAGCEPAIDGLNACLGSLSCDEFFAYWQALELITNEQDPGEFPCAAPLVEAATCLDGGSTPTPPGDG